VPESRPADELERPVADYLRRDHVALRADHTVQQALEYLRSQNLGERVVYFYVTDADGRLVGVLPTRRLLMGAPDARVADLAQRNAIAVAQTASLLLACELFVLHRLLALPVVDSEGRLLGLIDISLFTEEMFDVSERQAANDVFQIIGVRLAQTRHPTPWSAFRRRFPWLLCNVAGGIACALLAARYERFLENVVVIALFIPIVLALAESVSMQAVTLTLQALHEQRATRRFVLRTAARELATAALLGAATGLLVGTVSLAWKRDLAVAAAISGTILLSIMTACLLGVVLPSAIRALRGDPKIAGGPIVLATADVLTLGLYFEIAGALLG